ncbi:acylphosphatase [candidate division KSB3 bacterium]|uniref:Acylphosphatase n=1 Tax=candidate division KSB3 bacterium TaxID=2044937 RepID=A0A2G6KCS6_9BACT|nr:MAG: acylphosphatase [candidate division KSB3 bacterium]
MAYIGMHVYVSGLVQGVAFRYSAMREARHLGVGGWVKNLRDGRVELLIEGESVAVSQMVDWCRHGPSSARVTECHVDQYPYSGAFLSFDVEF